MGTCDPYITACQLSWKLKCLFMSNYIVCVIVCCFIVYVVVMAHIKRIIDAGGRIIGRNAKNCRIE